jgi:hypothetical protein
MTKEIEVFEGRKEDVKFFRELLVCSRSAQGNNV